MPHVVPGRWIRLQLDGGVSLPLDWVLCDSVLVGDGGSSIWKPFWNWCFGVSLRISSSSVCCDIADISSSSSNERIWCSPRKPGISDGLSRSSPSPGYLPSWIASFFNSSAMLSCGRDRFVGDNVEFRLGHLQPCPCIKSEAHSSASAPKSRILLAKASHWLWKVPSAPPNDEIFAFARGVGWMDLTGTSKDCDDRFLLVVTTLSSGSSFCSSTPPSKSKYLLFILF